MGGLDKKVDAAVILAAGYGKRLLPHTKKCPKPLLNVDGIPVIERIFCSLSVAKIKYVVIVIGHLGYLLKEYALNKHSAEFKLIFVTQHHICGSADAMERAKTELIKLNQRYYLVLAADYLLPEDYLINLINFHCSGPQEISLSLRVINKDKVTDSSVVEFGENNEILLINEKPSAIPLAENPVSSSLIYILPRLILDYFEYIIVNERGEKELPSLINKMIADGITARGFLQAKLPDWETLYKDS